jgi:hypothetical protein
MAIRNVDAAVVAALASAATLLLGRVAFQLSNDGSRRMRVTATTPSPLNGQSHWSVTATVTVTESPDWLHASSVRVLPPRRNRHRDAPMSRLRVYLATKHR